MSANLFVTARSVCPIEIYKTCGGQWQKNGRFIKKLAFLTMKPRVTFIFAFRINSFSTNNLIIYFFAMRFRNATRKCVKWMETVVGICGEKIYNSLRRCALRKWRLYDRAGLYSARRYSRFCLCFSCLSTPAAPVAPASYPYSLCHIEIVTIHFYNDTNTRHIADCFFFLEDLWFPFYFPFKRRARLIFTRITKQTFINRGIRVK